MATLPDADAILVAAVRAAVPGVNLGTQIPDDLLDRLPFVVARRFGGAAVDPRFLDRATVDVQTWAGSRKGAYDLAAEIRTGLRDSALNQITYPAGYIVRFRESSAPAEIRDAEQAGNVWRFVATYSLFMRPASN